MLPHWLTPGRIAGIALSLAMLFAFAASPAVVDRAREGLAGVHAATPAWLWLAAVCFACAHAGSGLAWRRALLACDAPTGRVDAVARQSVGSLVNAVAPAQLGGAVRVALFGRICGPGGTLTAAGAAAAVGATRVVWLALVAAVAAGSGAVPSWVLAILTVAGAGAAAAAVVARRVTGRRTALLMRSFRELGRQPRAVLEVTAWCGATTLARLAAATAAVAAFDVPQPVLAAFLVVAALDLAAILPLTPGNVGITAAAVAFALGAHGVASETALAAGIALSGVETLTSLAMGLGGCLALADTHVRPVVQRAAAAVGCSAIAWAFGVTVVLPAA